MKCLKWYNENKCLVCKEKNMFKYYTSSTASTSGEVKSCMKCFSTIKLSNFSLVMLEHSDKAAGMLYVFQKDLWEKIS